MYLFRPGYQTRAAYPLYQHRQFTGVRGGRKSRQSLILALCDLEGLLCSQKQRWAGLQALLWEDPSLPGFVGASAPGGDRAPAQRVASWPLVFPWPPLGPRILEEGFCSIEQL